MSYDNLSNVSQNILKFYQQLTGEERIVPFILVGTISNVLAMEIGWTDLGSGGYILVSCAHSTAHSNTSHQIIMYDVQDYSILYNTAVNSVIYEGLLKCGKH
jgi:hypothetical protein